MIEARAAAVAALADAASAAFDDVAGYPLVVRYAPNVPADGPETDVAEGFRERLAERRADELQRRTSLVGPHRDDLELAVRDLGARGFASHGETWVAALSLRLAVADAVEAAIGEPPIVIVDDPYSALDPARRDHVAARLAARAGQVVISVADDADVPAQATQVWDVRAGAVTGARLRPCRTRRGSGSRRDPRSGRSRRASATSSTSCSGRSRSAAGCRSRPCLGYGRALVGERLAEATAPVSLDGGCLVVRAADGPWGSQATYLADEIRRRADDALGGGVGDEHPDRRRNDRRNRRSEG